ncbi:YDG/SRA domain-containing protein [Kitasatospora sp. NPDC050543]|uniref:YDG/SRA domain-containing protein n=1 Tax=Kitasatospora sp. NPDC050543 TaxID=3364054 RepID=UPI0037BB5D25
MDYHRRPAGGGPRIADQDWENKGNAALLRSYQKGYPVRIIRGSEGDPLYSPSQGYRYDGLYQINSALQVKGRSEYTICQFKISRLPYIQQELSPIENAFAAALLSPEGDAELPASKTYSVQRIVRSSAVARRVKEWHNHTCQVCAVRLIGPDGTPYSEGAHIRALGKPHRGPDIESNILCLCPNCHVRFDLGAIYIDAEFNVVDRSANHALVGDLRRDKRHEIRPTFLKHHRERWPHD